MKNTFIKYALAAIFSLGAGWYTPDLVQAVQAQGDEAAVPASQDEALAPSRRAAVVRQVEHDDHDEMELPRTATGKTLLGVVLLACGWFFVYTIQRFNRRSKAEGDLDTRLPLILQSVTGGWEKLIERQGLMIDAAESRAARATEEREALMNRFIDYATTQQGAHDAKIDKMQAESAATYKRMDDRLNDCLNRDKVRDDKVAAIESRVTQIDQKQFNAALLTAAPSTLVAAPVAASAVVPQAGPTVSMQVPPGGLTVSPATG